MNELIINNYFYYLLLLLICLLVCIIRFRKKIFSGIILSRKTLSLLILIFIFGVLLRTFFVPHTFMVFDDEYLYFSNAKEFSLENKYCTRTAGIEELVCQRTPYPAGHPFFLSIFFDTFGINLKVAFAFSILLSSLSIIMIFLVSYSMFKDEILSLFSAIILTGIPVFLKLSGSASSESLSILLLLITFFFASRFLDQKSSGMLWLSAFSYLLLVQVRVENFLFIIPFLIFLFKEKVLLKRMMLQNFSVVLILIILLIPLLLNIGQQNIVVKKEASHLMNPKASLTFSDNISYFKENIGGNLLFWVNNAINPVIFTVLFVLGLIFMWNFDKRIFWTLLVFFLLFLTVYSMFTENLSFLFGRHFRFTLILYIPIIISSAFALTGLLNLMKKASHKKAFTIIVILFLLWIPSVYADFIQNNYHHNFDEFNFLSGLNIDENCYIFTNRLPPVSSLLENKFSTLQDFYFNKNKLDSCVLIYLNPYVLGFEIDTQTYLNPDELKLLTEKKIDQTNSLQLLTLKK